MAAAVANTMTAHSEPAGRGDGLRYEDVPDDIMRRIKAEAVTDLFTRLRAQGFVLRREQP